MVLNFQAKKFFLSEAHQMLLKKYYFRSESYEDTSKYLQFFLNNCPDLHLNDIKII